MLFNTYRCFSEKQLRNTKGRRIVITQTVVFGLASKITKYHYDALIYSG